MDVIDARLKGQVGTFSLDVAFRVPLAGITGLFGPSGCGKTSVLRCLAGLTRLKDAGIRVGGAVWQDGRSFVPPHKRPVGYVFQEPTLFGHLSVLDNLRYGLRRAHGDAAPIGVDSVVDLLGLRAFLHRRPDALSGGQRQRVAIGRAILARPRLLLMDEPLSALDRDAKGEILHYLEDLSKNFSIPILYVSHDLREMERLAGHLVLMKQGGGVSACGKLGDLLTDLSLPLAREPEAAVLLEVTVLDYDAAYALTICSLGDLTIFVPGRLGPAGGAHRLIVRAGDVSLLVGDRPHSSVLNILPARVLSAEMSDESGMRVLLALASGGEQARLLASVTRKSWSVLALKPGDPVFAQIKGMILADAG